jgi:hypothetical protein
MANHSHSRTYHARALGLVAADLTLQAGSGYGIASIARTGAGAYLITFTHDPGKFLNATYGLQALVPADLKGYTLVYGVYDATNKQLAFVVYNSSFAPADLIADQYVSLDMTFSEQGT